MSVIHYELLPRAHQVGREENLSVMLHLAWMVAGMMEPKIVMQHQGVVAQWRRIHLEVDKHMDGMHLCRQVKEVRMLADKLEV